MTDRPRITPGKPVPPGYRELKQSEKNGQFIMGGMYRNVGEWHTNQDGGCYAIKEHRIIVPIARVLEVPAGYVEMGEPHAFSDTGPTPWYENHGVMPCDGNARIEIGFGDGWTGIGLAGYFEWGNIADCPEAEIIQWSLLLPDGDRWNNPSGVTWAQLGAGFRFLTRREVDARAEAMNTLRDVPGPRRVGMWMTAFGYWDDQAFGNVQYTYRVPINTPFFA